LKEVFETLLTGLQNREYLNLGLKDLNIAEVLDCGSIMGKLLEKLSHNPPYST